MSSNPTYGYYPRAYINYPMTDISSVTISYSGNVNTTNYTYSGQTSGSFISGDLSFNNLYTFSIVPYVSSVSGPLHTVTINTTPSITGNYAATYSSNATTKLYWNGIYDYVKVSRAFDVGNVVATGVVSAATDLSMIVYNMPFIDNDLSGNTTYKYTVTPYIGGGGYNSAAYSVTYYTVPQCAYNLSAGFVDSSSIQMYFYTVKNSYNTSYYYTLSVVNGTYGYVTNVSGYSSPLLVQNLSALTNYTCYVKSTIDSFYNISSSSLSVTTLKPKCTITISSITGNSAIYSSSLNCYYAFMTSTSTSVSTGNITFNTGAIGGTLYIFAVGGGGGSNNDGGGGGGGIVQKTITYSSNISETITISVGNGGSSAPTTGQNGFNTTVTFLQNNLNNITAYGGGRGGKFGANGNNGGSGGGGGRGGSYKGGLAVNTNNNIAYNGGNGVSNGAGGGGGASMVGYNGTGSNKAGNGGDGILPSLPIISDYFPYYFSGGGGGNSNGGIAGNGGKGGGGGGCSSSGTAGTGGTNGINSGVNGINSSISNASTNAGSGGVNTGGGAGGLTTSGSSSNTAGSGIVIIAYN